MAACGSRLGTQTRAGSLLDVGMENPAEAGLRGCMAVRWHYGGFSALSGVAGTAWSLSCWIAARWLLQLWITSPRRL